MNVLKQMLIGKTDGEAHYKFIRYGKGDYERFLFEITRGKTSFKVKASYDFANDLFCLIAENARDTASVSGKIIAPRDFETEISAICNISSYSRRGQLYTAEINCSLSPEQMRRICERFSKNFILLNVKSSDFSLKAGKSLPKPGGNIKPNFCSATLPLDLLDEFAWDVKQDFQKMEIRHILKIEELIISAELKNNPAGARVEAKRKGKILRIVNIDGKETIKEADFIA